MAEKTIEKDYILSGKNYYIRLRDHLIDLPEFGKVYRELKRCLREAGYL